MIINITVFIIMYNSFSTLQYFMILATSHTWNNYEVTFLSKCRLVFKIIIIIAHWLVVTLSNFNFINKVNVMHNVQEIKAVH